MIAPWRKLLFILISLFLTANGVVWDGRNPPIEVAASFPL